MIHRGPDGEGTFVDDGIQLAMRRLSIIDLDTGAQPLFSEDRSLILIANGEIYNFIELREDLSRRGHGFATGSDCETILHLYEEFGADCLDHLRGMFAFALWDAKCRRLMLARDRMGEKPLYLFEAPGLLLFASEMKALLSSKLVPFELDPEAVNLYFHYQYVPEPRTPLRNVRKLDAGHMMLVDIDSWSVTERCYWRMEDAKPLNGDPVALIRQELETVADLVIRSDVPVGVALSGGLDSSVIAALASRRYPGKMHAFSVGYPGRPESDEREDAKMLAQYLGMPFHEVELETSAFCSIFPELVAMRDDPIADVSGYGYYAVMRLAREHGVPVVLQGQGGDELFWGYSWVMDAVRRSKLKSTAGLRSRLREISNYVRPGLPKARSATAILDWLCEAGFLPQGIRRYRRYRLAPKDQLVFLDLHPDFQSALDLHDRIYSTSFLAATKDSRPESLFTATNLWENLDVSLTSLISSTYLRENGITQGDRLGMASSVELRLPFVDHRLIEIVVGLRKLHPDSNLSPKSLLKAAVNGIVPDWAMQRPKRGFQPPISEWYRSLFSTYGRSIVGGYLVSNDILNPIGADGLSTGFLRDGTPSLMAFKALVLELWCQQMRSRVTGP